MDSAGTDELRPEAGEAEAQEARQLAGAKLVEARLIEPLERDGMKRHPRTSAEDHAAFRQRLKEKLRFMSAEGLDRLRPIVRACAEGASRNLWPGFATIQNMAYQIELPPHDQDEVVVSWLTSRAGPEMRSLGCLVEMVEYIRKYRRRPEPGGRFEREVRDLAANRARTSSRIEAEIREGVASDEDRDWLTRYRRAQERYSAIVDEGIARRRAAEETRA